MKLNILFILPVFMGVFGSCAVSKYDYYYCKMKSNYSIINNDSLENDRKIKFGNLNNKSKEEVYFIISDKNIQSEIMLTDPICIDFEHSEITINKTEYIFDSLMGNARLTFDPLFSMNNYPEWQTLGTQSLPDL